MLGLSIELRDELAAVIDRITLDFTRGRGDVMSFYAAVDRATAAYHAAQRTQDGRKAE